MGSLRHAALAAAGLIAYCALSVGAVTYPDTLWVPVTYYDYHANHSNPEFEPEPYCWSQTGGNPKGVFQNMVDSLLDAQHKPVKGPTTYYNKNIAKWFRPSTSGNYVRPMYNADGSWRLDSTVAYDSSFVNRVIADSLPFVHAYTMDPLHLGDPAYLGVYEINRPTFFPIDGRGFGTEPTNYQADACDGGWTFSSPGHNYSFGMTFHWMFTYHPGQKLVFRGDDDVWVFVNNRLELDIGGIHGAQIDTLYADSVAARCGLVSGNKYPLDFFYCERHVTGSDIFISTDFISVFPAGIIITTTPTQPDPHNPPHQPTDTCLLAGQCITYHAWVVDDTGGVQNGWSNNVAWDIRDSLGNPIPHTLTADSGAFCFTKAYGRVDMILTYTDPDPPNLQVHDTLHVCVNPGPATHMVIEPSPLESSSPRADNPFNPSLVFTATDAQKQAYAVMRDAYGNWVGLSQATTWTSHDTTRVTALGGVASQGQGLINRVAVVACTVSVFARDNTSGDRDTVLVDLRNVSYDSLRIVTTAHVPIQNDTLTVDQSQRLLAEGKNSATGTWDNLPVDWSKTGITTNPNAAPTGANYWDVVPGAAGTGTISVTRTGSASKTINVVFLTGAPASLVLYPAAGDPGSQTPIPSSTIGLAAGTSDSLYAKIFDHIPEWLSQYENTPSLGALIQWTVIDDQGVVRTGYLNRTTGSWVIFSPTRAHHVYRVIATFGTFSDTAMYAVGPGAATQLSIEASSDSTASPNAAVRWSPIVFASTQAARTAFAVLRDQYGNYVRASQATGWTSADTTIAAAAVDSAPVGRGLISRRAVSGQTTVRAAEGTMWDTVTVQLQNITYDSLRIVVQVGANKVDIDSLVMRTDQSTTLYALGLRSDNHQWVQIGVNWTNTNPPTTPTPPTGSDHWALQPATPGTGIISIALNGKTDQITYRFLPGLPASINIYSRPGDPVALGLSPLPNSDSAMAGDTVRLVGKMFDFRTVWLSAYETDPSKSALIHWSISDPTAGSFNATQGYSVYFIPTKAHACCQITATYRNVAGDTTLTDVISLCVKPAAASQLVIEGSADSTFSPNAPAPLPNVSLSSRDTTKYAYAILRDRYGNWVAPCNPSSWTSLDTTVVTVTVGFAVNGEGVIRRNGVAGTTMVVAQNQSGTLRDTVLVILQAYGYDSLRIVVQVGASKVDISTLSMRTDQDTVLYALGLRSDNGQWVPAPGAWSNSNPGTTPTAPTGQSWSFQPVSAGSGTIAIDLNGKHDQIAYTFGLGLPQTLDIYRRAGDPVALGLLPYPPAATTTDVHAGDTVPLVAKLFDLNHVWLSAYETDPTRTALFSWSVSDGTAGTFQTAQGYTTAFYPTKAYTTVRIAAVYRNVGGDTTRTDTISLHILPGVAARLTIEGDPSQGASQNAAAPLSAIHLTSTDTVRTAYAVLRDRFGNYVGASNPTTWTSSDTTVVTATPGFVSQGEGVVQRTGVSGSAVVTAIDQGTGFTATVPVQLDAYTIDALRIVVQIGIQQVDIDSLRQRIDQDTTLYVLGLRSDTRRWVAVDGAWAIATVSATPSPQPGAEWQFTPVDTGHGVIRVTLGNARDSIRVTFVAGLPARITIADRAGDPGLAGVHTYPDVDTVNAGDSLSLAAKMFDKGAHWLSVFETDPAQSTLIHWSVDDTTVGRLHSPGGSQASYVPVAAHQTVHITVTYRSAGGDTTLTDLLTLVVMPGPEAQLVIEGSPGMVSPNAAVPLDSIRLNSRDTTRAVYAVLRDRLGNYIGSSTVTVWSSADTSTVTVATGYAVQGEGLIRRSGVSGRTTVTALDSSGLSGSVVVILDAYTIDSLRIMVRLPDSLIAADSLTDITTLQMRTDQDTTLYVRGLRSDNGQWQFVSGDWSSSLGAVNPPAGRSSWTLTPADTGHGIIVVALGPQRDTVQVVFLPGLPSQVTLYRSNGQPRDVDRYGDSRIDVGAGDTVPLIADIFDRNGVWLGAYQSTDASVARLFAWTVVDNGGATQPTGQLDGSGYMTAYRPTVSGRTVDIIVTFTVTGGFVYDTLRLNVVPGAPDHIVIEAAANAGSVSPNRDNPLDTLVITAIDTIQHAYAILRDRFGNYIRNDQNAYWASLDTSIVDAAVGLQSQGQGVVTSTGAGGVAQVTAVDTLEPLLAHRVDTVAVKVLEYYYKALRIAYRSSIADSIDSLVMSTNDDTTLWVFGLRSDNQQWEPTSVSWALSDSVTCDPAPSVGQSWRFSPVKPSTAAMNFIRVYLDNDQTIPDTLLVQFTRGDPVQLTATVTTPADSLIAGQPIRVALEIDNRDGLEPALWCGAVHLSDLLPGDSAKLIYTDITRKLDTVSMSATAEVCFQDGLADVQVILYNAPLAHTAHALVASLNSTLTDTTARFVLLPGPLARVRIENYDGTPAASVTMSSSDQIMVYTRGYDQFGNALGDVACNWTVAPPGSLPAPSYAVDVRRLFYEVDNADRDMAGYLVATAVDSAHGVLSDSLHVAIQGHDISLLSAVTRDLNGDGYLDAIEVRFSRPVSVSDSALLASLTFETADLSFVNSTVIQRSGDSVFVIGLVEDSSKGTQTDWRPYVLFTGLPGVASVMQGTLQCDDGAAPVVVSVTRYIADGRRDRIEIRLSEPIRTVTGSSLGLFTLVSDLFSAYSHDASSGLYVPIPGMFIGINSIDSIVGDSVIVFTMTNGQDLMAGYYVNIKTPAVIGDNELQSNVPIDNNRKVPVLVKGEVGIKPVACPNPNRVDSRHVAAGHLSAADDPAALPYVSVRSNGGFAVVFMLPIPEYGAVHVRRTIYDVAGNLVQTASESDLLVSLREATGGSLGTSTQVVLYWNGYNMSGLPVAPGMYREVLSISYDDPSHKDVRALISYGVKR